MVEVYLYRNVIHFIFLTRYDINRTQYIFHFSRPLVYHESLVELGLRLDYHKPWVQWNLYRDHHLYHITKFLVYDINGFSMVKLRDNFNSSEIKSSYHLIFYVHKHRLLHLENISPPLNMAPSETKSIEYRLGFFNRS